MPVKINASTSSGLVVDSDLTGSLQLQTGGNPAISIDSSQVANFAKQFQIGGVLPPAFSASASTNQSISATTFTKVNFGTEQFDTNNNFSSSRFTPTVAGYYQFNASINFGGGSTVTYGIVSFYKNGGEYNRSIAIQSTANLSIGGSSLIYLNGTTDYLEVYAYSGQSGTQLYGDAGTTFTYFHGVLVRAA
jgi:hypothetical protein